MEEYVQFLLSDPAAPDGPSYGIIGTSAWRFVDLTRRLDFLLAGLGWCRMPKHVVAEYLSDGRLIALEIENEPARAAGPLTIYAALMNNRVLGRAEAGCLTSCRSGSPELALAESILVGDGTGIRESHHAAERQTDDREAEVGDLKTRSE